MYLILAVYFQVWWAQHLAAPFGAIGSVHGWERVGAAAAHIARALLKLPMLRYVDEYFGPGRSVCCLVRVYSLYQCVIDHRKETVLHGLQCFVRLIRVLLGSTAITDEKCECGPSLVVLGVYIALSEKGYTLKPAAATVSC